VWPGQCSTSKRCAPSATLSPSPSQWSGVAHGKTVAATLLLQSLQQKLVAPVGTLDRHVAERLAQFVGAAGVIQMAMRQPDALDADAGLLDRGEDTVDLAARIHHHPLHGAFVPENGAVLLERRHGDDRAT
jgi:hypothetical protein